MARILALLKPYGGGAYLEDRHFFVALGVAACIHLFSLTTWLLIPRADVLEIPVRTLNIKLGDVEDMEIDPGTIKATPVISNDAVVEHELKRALEPSPMPADPNAVIKALGQAVKTGKEKLAELKAIERQKQQQKLAEARPPAPPEKKKEVAPAKKPEQQHYVRQPLPTPQTATQAGGAGGGSVLGNSTQAQAEIIARYEQTVSAWITKFKVYPPEARAAGLEGTPVVRVRIDRRGNVRAVDLDVSSGFQLLDRAALQMIHNANPLPPMPDAYEVGRESKEFTIPVLFNLK